MTFDDDASPQFIPVPPGTRLRALIEPGEPPAPTPEVLERWEAMRAEIPRLFDAPILAVSRIDRAAATIHCRRETYQRLVVQPHIATNVEQLSITGILLARDEADRRCVMLGQRGAGTRMYPGLWELGPAGGIDAPHADELTHDDIIAELAREVREEAGLEIAGFAAAPIGIVHDPLANSHDIAVLIDLVEIPRASGGNWEYQQIRWLAFEDLPALLTDPEEAIIPPTRLLLQLIVDDEF